MKALPAILALLVVSTIVPASAEHEQLSVGNLQEICTRSDNGSKEACRYYILGVTEGTRMAAAFVGDKTHFCIPEGVSLVAVEALIKNEIEEDLTVYPADRDLAAVGFVTPPRRRHILVETQIRDLTPVCTFIREATSARPISLTPPESLSLRPRRGLSRSGPAGYSSGSSTGSDGAQVSGQGSCVFPAAATEKSVSRRHPRLRVVRDPECYSLCIVRDARELFSAERPSPLSPIPSSYHGPPQTSTTKSPMSGVASSAVLRGPRPIGLSKRFPSCLVRQFHRGNWKRSAAQQQITCRLRSGS